MSRTTRQLSQSMHEMYEIPDLKAYADAMDCMDGNKIPKTEEDDDFMLLDLSSSDSSIKRPARSIQVTTGSSPIIRRCSMSCARLPSEVDRQRRTFSLMTMHGPDIHSTIEEEEEEEEEEHTCANNDANTHKDVCLDKTLYNGERMNVTVRPTEDVTNSANRRPSRRVSKSGPLKSSLRTSQTASVMSDDVDESEHSMKRNVSFSSLEIRSYGMTLGPNPSSSGPPVSLDYSNHKSTEDHDIECYEQLRSVSPDNPEPGNPRRNKCKLFLLPSQRHYLLMRDAGFSRMQIKQPQRKHNVLPRPRNGRKVPNVRFG